MTTTRRRLLASLILVSASLAQAQVTAPQAVPVPIASFYAGNGTTTLPAACTATVLTSGGANLGDDCTPANAIVSAPQGISADSYGNVYFGDYNNKVVRVVYNGNPKLAAAITAANSGYAVSASRNSNNVVPVIGNIYTIAGGLTAAITATGNACSNYATSGQPLGINAAGDGCPATATYLGSRAVATDADGNIFIADYVNSRIRVVCVDCSSGKLAQQLITLENATVTAPINGYIYNIAGYAGTTNTATGTGGANGFRDAILAANSTLTDSTTGSMMRTPTAIYVDAFDDVYIADQGNNAVRVLYNQATAGTNPLANLILAAEAGNTTFIIGSGSTGAAPAAVTSVTKGFLYTLAGTVCHIGTSSGGSSSYECAQATAPATNNVLATRTAFNTNWGLTVDAGGNVYIGDGGTAQVRVIYGGVSNPLTLPNAGTTTLTLGNVYELSGNGTVTQNGVTAYNEAYSGPEGLAFDDAGNLYITDTTRASLFEIYAATGTVAQIAGSGVATTLGAGDPCNGSSITSPTGPLMSDAFGNGCPATQAKFVAPRGSIAFDPQGNILFTDNSGSNVRKLAYNNIFPAASTTTSAQIQAFTFMSAQTLGIGTPVAIVSPAGDFIDGGSDTCTSALVATAGTSTVPPTTCVVNIKFSPQSVGTRTGSVTLNNASTRIGAENLGGVSLGAALTLDPAVSTTVGTGVTPNGIFITPAGDIYITDTTASGVAHYAGSTPNSIATGFSTPSGVAVDGQGNLFVADTLASTITEIPVNGTRFTLTAAVSHPHGLALDIRGNLYIADTGNNRILEIPAGGSTPIVLGLTGLSAPQAVTVTGAGIIYVADTGNSRVVTFNTTTNTQTTIAVALASNSIAVDAASNIYLTSGASAYEFPSGSGSGTGTVIATGLVTPQALALDAAGNLYIADTGLTGYKKLARTTGSYAFGTSPATLNLTNVGNQTLTLTGTPFYTQTDGADFTITSPSSGGCATGTLATICTLSAALTPTTSGSLTDAITITSNAANASPIQFTLTGTGNAVATTTALAIDAATATYGHTTTLTATVTQATGTTTPTGTVTFKSNGTTLPGSSAVTVNASGVATLNIVLPVGSYPTLTAVFTPTDFSFITSTSTQSLSLSVSAATLTVTATSTSRLVNTANPALTYTITGFVNGDLQSVVSGTPTETTTAVMSSPAASYPITITQNTLAATNYIFTFVNGTLVVSGSTAQTITFGTLPNVTYGVAPITLGATASSTLAVTYSVTGPASISGSTLTITGAGNVTVTAAQNGNSTYAAATPVPQSFTVNKAALTVTATSTSRTYGAANPTPAYTITGFVNNDAQTVVTGTPTENIVATATSTVAGSPYTIGISTGSIAATNYIFNLVNGALTVTPATLTVTATAASRNYGAANPTFTASYSGQQNSETFTASASTTATTASPAGPYIITPTATGTQIANYTINPVTAVLTVSKVTPAALLSTSTNNTPGGINVTLTATFTSPTSGTPTGTASFFSGATQIGSAVALVSGVAVLNTTALPAGTDSVTAVYSTDTNFNAATTPAITITVTAPFSVTSSSPTALTMPHAYQQATSNIAINPGGNTSTLTFACTGLPAQLNCSFAPATLSLSGLTALQTVVMTVSNSNASAHLDLQPASRTREIAYGGLLLALPASLLFLVGMGSTRKRLRRSTMLLLLFALSIMGIGLTGCGTSSNFLAPSGSYNFQMTTSNGTTVVQTINFTLTVQ